MGGDASSKDQYIFKCIFNNTSESVLLIVNNKTSLFLHVVKLKGNDVSEGEGEEKGENTAMSMNFID